MEERTPPKAVIVVPGEKDSAEPLATPPAKLQELIDYIAAFPRINSLTLDKWQYLKDLGLAVAAEQAALP